MSCDLESYHNSGTFPANIYGYWWLEGTTINDPSGTQTIYDITDYLLDQDIITEEKLELSAPMEIDNGGIELMFRYNSTLWSYLTSSTILNDRFKGIALRVYKTEGGVTTNVFWGAINKFESVYDEQADTIFVTAKNMFDFVLDSYDSFNCRAYIGTGDSTLNTEISAYFGGGSVFSSLHIGIPSTWGTTMGQTRLYSFGANGFPIKSLVEEIQKKFNCYFYCNADKELHLVGRLGDPTDTSNSDNIQPYILDESIEVTNEDKKYNSVLVNMALGIYVDTYLSGVNYVNADTWGILYEEGNELKGFGVTDTADIDEKAFQYVDLRQKVAYTNNAWSNSTSYLLWDRSEFDYTKLWQIYRPITNRIEQMTCTYLGTDLSLLQKVYCRDHYVVTEMRRNWTQDTTELVLKRLINTTISNPSVSS